MKILKMVKYWICLFTVQSTLNDFEGGIYDHEMDYFRACKRYYEIQIANL